MNIQLEQTVRSVHHNSIADRRMAGAEAVAGAAANSCILSNTPNKDPNMYRRGTVEVEVATEIVPAGEKWGERILCSLV